MTEFDQDEHESISAYINTLRLQQTEVTHHQQLTAIGPDGCNTASQEIDEHKVIACYTNRILSLATPTCGSTEITLQSEQGDGGEDKVTTTQSNHTTTEEIRQLLEELQIRNFELKDRIARLKQVYKAKDDVIRLCQANQYLEERITSLQGQKAVLTLNFEEKIKQMKARNNLSPTTSSQADSELSVNTSTSPDTPLTTSSSYFVFPEPGDWQKEQFSFPTFTTTTQSPRSLMHNDFTNNAMAISVGKTRVVTAEITSGRDRIEKSETLS